MSIVLFLGQAAQALGGAFGRDVALRLGQQLVADHELAHRGRAQQRRVEVRVQVPLGVRLRRRSAAGGSPSSTGTRPGTGCRSAWSAA